MFLRPCLVISMGVVGGEEYGNGQGYRDEDDRELGGIENQVMEVDMDPISDRDAAVTNTGVQTKDTKIQAFGPK